MTSSAQEAARSESAPAQSALEKRPEKRSEEILRRFHEESTLQRNVDMTLLKRLWPFARPYRALIFLSVGFGMLTATGALVRPLIMQFAIDQGVMQRDPDTLLLGGMLLASVVLVEQILNFVQIYSIQIAGARSMADLRRHVFRFLHTLRLSFFDRTPVGRLVTRVTNDTDAILELFASGAFNALTDLVRLVGIVILMLTLDWQLSLIAFAALPPVAMLVRVVRQRAREAFREIRAKTARMNATMNEQVNGMSVVQAYGQQEPAAKEFDAINSAYRDANIRAIKWDATQDAALEMVASICLASIVISLGYRPVSFGTLVAFNAFLLQFFEPISALAQRFTILQSALSGAERVFGLLDTKEFDSPARDGAPPRDDGNAIDFENVTFEYKPNQPVLRDVTFKVRHREKIAVVGPTGAGKTTIASLMQRLYDVQKGTIRIDGEDVVSLARGALRSKFAVVPQDVFLFPGTVAQNIAAGQTPDLQRVTQALKRIEAYDVFASRPGGLDAVVEEQGGNFSAGERQLIAFARAIYRDADILILDEATASIDSDTEARLQRALEAVMKDRTALIIAHRLSTVKSADRVLAFHHGRLVEQGTHQELLEQGGLYARLHELHFARGEPV